MLISSIESTLHDSISNSLPKLPIKHSSWLSIKIPTCFNLHVGRAHNTRQTVLQTMLPTWLPTYLPL